MLRGILWVYLQSEPQADSDAAFILGRWMWAGALCGAGPGRGGGRVVGGNTGWLCCGLAWAQPGHIY